MSAAEVTQLGQKRNWFLGVQDDCVRCRAVRGNMFWENDGDRTDAAVHPRITAGA
jgi:hypothetical protein